MQISYPQRLESRVRLVAKRHGGLEGFREQMRKKAEARSGNGPLEAATTGGDDAAAINAVDQFLLGAQPSPNDMDALEAIIDAEHRPVVYVQDNTYLVGPGMWSHLDQEPISTRLHACIPLIGRLELPGNTNYPYGGTGFVVGDGLVMTNRHVAEIFASGIGSSVTFRPGASAALDLKREFGKQTGPRYSVRSVVMIHPYWDMAILKVDGLAPGKWLLMSDEDARQVDGRDVVVIGYPAFDSRNPADVQNQLFNGQYGVKRLQPGDLHGAWKAGSFGKLVNAATHDCSTLGGNSGSAVIDTTTGMVIALHFGGRYKERNFAVPMYELSLDSRVIDAGVKFAKPLPNASSTGLWWRGVEATILQTPTDDSSGTAKSASIATTVAATDKAITLEIPLRISFSIGGAQAPESMTVETEALKMPWHDSDYTGRAGYDPDFLNDGAAIRVPMPTANDESVLAPDANGGKILHYQNFSIRMHAKRRLALITASNVTKEDALRAAGKGKTRKILSGLGDNDQERWFPDPRLDAKYQLPDVFFTKDRKAFDKGHLVRREDVAWGPDYDTLRRANGDTYHVTNCSPQVAGFNQSARGEENWGDLENHVLTSAQSERLCVFAGPVLSDDDEVFVGVGDGGTPIRAKIPSRFWKVIVARVEDGIAAYGFVLEQDLSAVEYEFTVPPEFEPAMYPIADIETMTGVSFDTSIRDADQYESDGSVELAMQQDVPRRRLKK